MICTCRKPDFPCPKCVKEAEEKLRKQFLAHPEVSDSDDRQDPDIDHQTSLDIEC